METLDADTLATIIECLPRSSLSSVRLACKSLRDSVGIAAIKLRPSRELQVEQLLQVASTFPRAYSLNIRSNPHLSSASLGGLVSIFLALPQLKQLHLTECEALTSLPEGLSCLEKLTVLHMRNCTALITLPDSLGRLSCLEILNLDDCTSLPALPESTSSLSMLKLLSMMRCAALSALPDALGQLASLGVLSLPGCSALAALPDSLDGLISVWSVDLDRCSALVALPDSFSGLKGLRFLRCAQNPEGVFTV